MGEIPQRQIVKVSAIRQRWIVMNNGYSVGGKSHVELDPVCTKLHSKLKCCFGVLWGGESSPPMSEYRCHDFRVVISLSRIIDRFASHQPKATITFTDRV